MNLTTIERELRKERDQAQRQVERLDSALTALGRLDGTRGISRRQGRSVSAASRARMAAAQRARRARERGQKPTNSKTPIPIRAKRRISAAGLARIRAAQKARWAKAKRQKKAA
jgi:hypothetical protein